MPIGPYVFFRETRSSAHFLIALFVFFAFELYELFVYFENYVTSIANFLPSLQVVFSFCLWFPFCAKAYELKFHLFLLLFLFMSENVLPMFSSRSFVVSYI